MSLILVRYNELGLKSPKVRRRFQSKLVKNIEEAFLKNKLECIIDSTWGRIYVHCDDIDSGTDILTRVFGISSVSVVEKGSGSIDDIINSSLDYFGKKIQKGQTFAVRTRRYGTHDFTSMELSERMGAAILERFKEMEIRVELGKPDLTLFIEVRHDDYYIFTDKQIGAGGLPMGTQGKVLGIYENPNSFLAWWLLLKRGVTLLPVYLTDKPIAEEVNINEIIDDDAMRKRIADFQNWVPKFRFRYLHLPEEPSYVFNTEMYEKILQMLGEKHKIDALISPAFIDEIEKNGNMDALSEFKIPIFYPLVAFSSEEVQELEFRVFGHLPQN